MNNKQYWIDRENQKLNKGIKDCNKLAKELEGHYKLAIKQIEKEEAKRLRMHNSLAERKCGETDERRD